MHIKSRPLSASLKLLILAFGILALTSQFSTFGFSAWRLLATYFLILLIAYYSYVFIRVVLPAKFQKPQKKDSVLPVVQWSLLTFAALIFGAHLAYADSGLYPALAPAELIGGLTCIILPLALLADWFLFSLKGRLRPLDPLYFLVVPVFYFCLILLTSINHVGDPTYLYPFSFLSPANPGVTLLWLGLTALFILAFGYLGFALDQLLERVILTASISYEASIKKDGKKDPEHLTKVTKTAKMSNKPSVKPIKTVKVMDIKPAPKAPKAPDAPKPSKKSQPAPKSSTKINPHRSGGAGKKTTAKKRKSKASKTTGAKQPQRG